MLWQVSWKVLRTRDPTAKTARTTTAAIRATSRPYSTAEAPSSARVWRSGPRRSVEHVGSPCCLVGAGVTGAVLGLHRTVTADAAESSTPETSHSTDTALERM